jgi:hypothetical protein
MSMEITETKYEWQLGEYLVRTYVGEYGIHNEWFKGDDFIDSNDVPDLVLEAHEQLCEEEGL